MHSILRHTLALMGALIACSIAAAQDGTTAYQFLNVPVSSHVYALGGHNLTIIDDDINLVEQNPALFAWLDLLDLDVWIILALMVAVAGFTMVSGLLIIIIERTNMIGTLKSMGAKNKTIRHTFLWFAVFIIAKGMAIGNIIGIGLCLLQRTTGLVKLDPETYYVAVVPVELNVPAILLINIATLIISIIVLIAPSFLVSHIDPAKSMKYE